MVARRRRRHRVGLDGLRPAARHAVRRHRQRLAVEPRHPLTGRRRQPVPLVDPGDEPGHRPPEVALPGHAIRQLGLHVDPAHHPRGPHDRRQAAQGADAGAEERFLLRAGPGHGRVAVGGQVHSSHVGDARRPEDRTSGRNPGSDLQQGNAADRPGRDRRPQLAADGLQPADGSRVHPGDAADGHLSAVAGIHQDRQVHAARPVLESGHRLEQLQRHDRRPVEAIQRLAPAGPRLTEGLGSRAEEDRVGDRTSGVLERRAADDRGQPAVPGHGRRQAGRLCGGHRQDRLGRDDDDRHRRAAGHV